MTRLKKLEKFYHPDSCWYWEDEVGRAVRESAHALLHLPYITASKRACLTSFTLHHSLIVKL